MEDEAEVIGSNLKIKTMMSVETLRGKRTLEMVTRNVTLKDFIAIDGFMNYLTKWTKCVSNFEVCLVPLS